MLVGYTSYDEIFLNPTRSFTVSSKSTKGTPPCVTYSCRWDELEEEKVVEVAAGGFCTAVVTVSGKAVVFGHRFNETVGVVWEDVE